MAHQCIGFSVALFIIFNHCCGSSLKTDDKSSPRPAFSHKTVSHKQGRCTPLPNYIDGEIGNWTKESGRSKSSDRTYSSHGAESSESIGSHERRERLDEIPNETKAALWKHLLALQSLKQTPCTPLPNYLGDETGNREDESVSRESHSSDGTSTESQGSSERISSSEKRDEIPDETRVVLIRHIENEIALKGQLDMLQQELKNLSKIVQSLGTSLEETLLQQEKLNEDVLTVAENVTKISTAVRNEDKTVQSRITKACGRLRKGKRNQRKNTCPFPKAYKKGNYQECPETFQRFWGRRQGTCLWFSNITASWAEALVYCAVMDSELAILDNGVLRDNVTHYMFEQENVNMYYLGGSEYQDGDWQWLRPRKNFQIKSPPWKMGQREKAGNGELCLAITRSKQSRKRYNWTSVPCDRKIRFICQRQLTK